MTPEPPRKYTERRIVAFSVAMSLCFGPIGMALSGLSVLGGLTESPLRWIVLTSWFAVFGLVMGLVLAYAWRVENPHLARKRQKRESEEYWIGDWNGILDDANRPKSGATRDQLTPPNGPEAP